MTQLNHIYETSYRPMVNVRAYGAKGDGVTDDAAAIQAAINSTSSFIEILPTGGTVFFPSGQYLVKSQITVLDNVRLLGLGKTNSRLVKGFNGDLLTLGNQSGIEQMALWGDGANFTGKGIVINGTNGTQSCAHLSVINFADNCIFFNFGAGSQSSWIDIITSQYNAASGSGRYAIAVARGATGAATGTPSTTVITANIGDTTNASGWYNGTNFEMTNGAAANQIKTVTSSINNGGGSWTFTITTALSVAPSAGDNLEVFINSGVPRKFVHIECNGSPIFDLGASNDTYIFGSTLGDILYDTQTRGCHIVACRLFGGSPQHLQGFGNTIVACDVGPQLILDATGLQWTIGPNTYNDVSAPVINNSTDPTNMIFDYFNIGSSTRGFQWNSGGGFLASPSPMGVGTAAANYVKISGGTTGNYPQIAGTGSDADVGINFISKGAGEFEFITGTVGGPAVVFNQLGSPTFNGAVLTVGSGYPVQATLQGNTTGNPIVLQPIGSDSSISINLEPKGSGGVVATSYIEATGLMQNDLGIFQASGANNVPATIIGAQNDGVSAVAVVLDNSISLTSAGAKTVSIRNHGAEVAFFDKDGRYSTSYGDSTGTPGSVVNNNLTGRAIIANGAGSCAVTNNKVTSTSIILITIETTGTSADNFPVTHTGGSFTVNAEQNGVSHAVEKDTTFSWVIINS